MKAIDVLPGPDGLERWTFDCRTCGQTETKVIASDPLKSDASRLACGRAWTA
jgi:hypothetical protein